MGYNPFERYVNQSKPASTVTPGGYSNVQQDPLSQSINQYQAQNKPRDNSSPTSSATTKPDVATQSQINQPNPQPTPSANMTAYEQQRVRQANLPQGYGLYQNIPSSQNVQTYSRRELGVLSPVAQFGFGVIRGGAGIIDLATEATIKGNPLGAIGSVYTGAFGIPGQFVKDPFGTSGELTGAYVVGGFGGKVAQSRGIRIADYSGYKGIGIKTSEKVHGIVGLEDGKIKVGTPVIKGELAKANTPFETSILEKTIGAKYPTEEVASYGIGKNLMKLTEKTQSAFTEKTFNVNIERLTPKGNLALTEYIKGQKDIEVYGSTAQKMQSPYFRLDEKGIPGKPADIDIVVPYPSQTAIDVTNVLKSAGEENIRINPKNPALVEKYYKDSDAWGHLVDIHPKAEGGLGYNLFPDPYLGLAFKKQGPTMIGGVKAMRLSEQGIRKGVSVFTPMTKAKIGEFKSKGLSFKENEFAPEAHRVKDVGDFLSAEKTLLESKKLAPSLRLSPFAGRTRAKIGAAEYALGELKTYFEKKYNTKINLGESKYLMYENKGTSGNSIFGSIAKYSAFPSKGYSANVSIVSYPSKETGYRSNRGSSYKLSDLGKYPSPAVSQYKGTPSPFSPSPGKPSGSYLYPSSPDIPKQNYPGQYVPPSAKVYGGTTPSSLIYFPSPTNVSPPINQPNKPYGGTIFGGNEKLIGPKELFMPTADNKKRRVDEFKFTRGFDVFLRRRGKFIKVSQAPLSKQEAIGLGAFKAEQTLGATFKIKEAAGQVMNAALSVPYNMGKFYPKVEKGEEVFIQKAKFRLSTGSEVKEIQYSKKKKNPFSFQIPRF